MKNQENETSKSKQLELETHESKKHLTTNQGVRIGDNQNTLKVGERGPSLLEDFIMREKITHFDHERIPERVVHARGSAAHGYFQVYENLSKFTKAKFLQNPELKTPVFVRFSTVAGFRGSADTVRDVRGFATKFYTEEGNYDLVGNNMPVFFIQDGIKFPDVIHAVKPEQHNEIPQASSAHDTFWDFISLTPESMHMIMWVLSDRALPRSYSMMEGFGVHTFRLINEEGKSCFVKFHWKPVNGIHSLLFDEAQIIGGKDPDFNRRDLWESIESGNYPEFELGIQILNENELDRVEFDILDPTKIWPEEDIPVKLIGKMTLNRNPDNFFAETEQVAFHPGHVVPGIDFTNDPLLQGRLFSYTDTQLSRLGGPNFHEIPINRPIADLSNNQRDGIMRQMINKGGVNYEPNSLGKGCPMQSAWKDGGFVSFPENITGEKVRKRPESFGDHYSQASLFWNSMSEVEQNHIIKAFHFELGKVKHKHIREKMVEHLSFIDHDLAVNVAIGIGIKAPAVKSTKKYEKISPALSLENHKSKKINGRKIAILAFNGVEKTQIDALKKMLETEAAKGEIVSLNLNPILSSQDEEIEVDKNFLTADSVFYDAIVIPSGIKSLNNIISESNVIRFFFDAYKHCKPIIAIGDGVMLLKNSSLKDLISTEINSNDIVNKMGVILAGNKVNIEVILQNFKESLLEYRYWEREKKYKSQF